MTPAPTMIETLELLRARRPLVHCMTNGVTAGLVANVLLALGAVPAMVEGIDEVADFAGTADALVINLGSLTPARREAMFRAAQAAQSRYRPWVLDPVAAGGIPARARFARELLQLRPAAIRGNASEIPALTAPTVPGQEAPGSGRGPDATVATGSALPDAARLSAESGAVVAVTGTVDWVLHPDGRAMTVHSGHQVMARVSGAGCAATAVIAACLAVQPDPLLATAHGLGIFGSAGAQAASGSGGPGSFVPALLDTLAALNAPALGQGTLRSETAVGG